MKTACEQTEQWMLWQGNIPGDQEGSRLRWARTRDLVDRMMERVKPWERQMGDTEENEA